VIVPSLRFDVRTGPGGAVLEISPAPSRLAERILEEAEWQPAAEAGPEAQDKPNPVHLVEPGRVKGALEILDQALQAGTGGKLALAISGGSDSLALLELAARDAGLRPTLIWADTGMEYPGTEAFLEARAQAYGLELRIARPPRTPIEQWQRTGWPFLGKMAARIWTKHHPDAGFKLNVSECCRELKIKPARSLTRNLGIRVQLTGQRGHVDDQARGLREHLDGALVWQQRDKLWIASPLTGWTDADVSGFSKERALEEHPAKAQGARTIGCLFCGGGAQFENSGIRVLRRTLPAAWRAYVVDAGAGAIILALRYGAKLDEIFGALRDLGGLEKLAQERPWLFDYTRRTPLHGYAKGARG
jgi:3'-phosphoadenosine 5'-phosphosulfate sulfotransferase (PAPS reductase)/FAD synthetase